VKLFVTGGTGFIGGHFLNAALQAGHEVLALRHGTLKVRLCAEPKWVESGMDQLVTSDFDGVDVLVHLAAAGVSPQEATWEELLKWNVTEPLRICRAALDAGVRRIVASGSYAEYGTAGEFYDFIPPTAPLEPTFPYAASKAASYLLLQALARSRNRQLWYGRIFSAFGEGQHQSNFWPSLRLAALAGEDFPMTAGEQIRDFIPVEDVAAALRAAVERQDLVEGEIRVENIGTGVPQTLRSFAEHWWTVWGAAGKLEIGKVPYRANEVFRFVGAISGTAQAV
jgi:nucleoside-diphosphate-sugar epimerase